MGPDGDRLAARPLFFVRLHEEDTVKLLVALVPEDDAFVIQLKMVTDFVESKRRRQQGKETARCGGTRDSSKGALQRGFGSVACKIVVSQ